MYSLQWLAYGRELHMYIGSHCRNYFLTCSQLVQTLWGKWLLLQKVNLLEYDFKGSRTKSWYWSGIAQMNCLASELGSKPSNRILYLVLLDTPTCTGINTTSPWVYWVVPKEHIPKHHLTFNVWGFTSAPLFKSWVTILWCPFQLAPCNAVWPFCWTDIS